MKENSKKANTTNFDVILFNQQNDKQYCTSIGTNRTRYTEQEMCYVHLSLCIPKKKSSLKGNASLPLKVEERIRGIPQYQVTYVRAEV